MLTLRITQTSLGPERHRASITLREDNRVLAAEAEFDFALCPQDRERFRWYLEDFLQFPLDPAPGIAQSVERRMAEVGTGLFKALFHANDQARDLWAILRGQLNDTRVEVVTGVQEAATIPWELLRDPTTDTALALRAQAFVRTHTQTAAPTRIPTKGKGPIRILLVICRPGGRADVPFRSVAALLIKSLGVGGDGPVHLDLLRPATFERLAEVLRQAKQAGRPYHVVHFDGHGVVLNVQDLFDGWEQKLSSDEFRKTLESMLDFDPQRFSPQAIYPRPRRPGRRGYLAFENSASAQNLRLVDGPELAALLAETGVPVLVLNACRSAHADPPPAPVEGQPVPDVHSQVRSLGSLALEVIDAGVPGVVAMRYNVYVVTAAQFVADLYAALAQGQALGEAVSLGRKQLAAQPLREIAYTPRGLQDWSVPVVYEAAPIELFPRPKKVAALSITVRDAQSTPERGRLDPGLPHRPDVGFFGRDETLLALDRAFDRQPVVLLHAYAGSGKTSTAAEFARWYALTGGVEGAVLFTSFEQYRTLPRVLDHLGQTFQKELERGDVHWLTLDDSQRRQVALDVLKQVSVLWVWDNVEPVAGFPEGTPSAWSTVEQRELADFLREARETKAKFLLTSRRDERGWLGDLPARVVVPRMPMQERVQLARALSEKHGRRLGEVEDWRPLLEFTEGNPLTLTVVVGHALREGCRTREDVAELVRRLRTGEFPVEDETAEGRKKSLGASLNYGFENAFTEDERQQVALLHLFQGFVDVDALQVMGHPDNPWRVPEVADLTREAGIALLDRGVEAGLLMAAGRGYYHIHPAVPWFFRGLFERHYPSPPDGGEGTGLRATRAFVAAMAEMGRTYQIRYAEDRREMIGVLQAEEANLLHAWLLARRHALWDHVTRCMQALKTLYNHTGRQAEWQRLLEEVVPDFMDLDTGEPLPGRADGWNSITEFRIQLATDSRQWEEAERLAHRKVQQEKHRAAPALTADPATWDGHQRNAIRRLATSLQQLGVVQQERGQPACVAALQEALGLCERIGDQDTAAECAFNLGHAYLIDSLRGLGQAEHWYRESLGKRQRHQRHSQALCLRQLGTVSLERFREARSASQPKEEQLRLLNEALRNCLQGLHMTPEDALADQARAHYQLGVIYQEAGDFDQALPHFQQAIRHQEALGDFYGAGNSRFGVALCLAEGNRLQEARAYAETAVHNLQPYGFAAADQNQRARQLIEAIDQKFTRVSRARVVSELSRLSDDLLDAIIAAFPEATLVSSAEATAAQRAEMLATWAEFEGPGLESLIVRAHQVDPLQGILRRVISDVTSIDAALPLFPPRARRFGGEESTTTEPRSIPLLVAVDDATVSLDDVPDFQLLSQIGRIIAGKGSLRTIAALSSHPRVHSVEQSPTVCAPECADSVPIIRATEVHQQYEEKGDKVIIAIIDTGIDVLHQAFRSSAGESRILAVWDQCHDHGPPPTGYTFGTLHTKADIDRYIANRMTDKDLAPDWHCHGTHVASIAAGKATGAQGFVGGVAPEAKIVVVVVKVDPEPGAPTSLGYSVSHHAALSFIKGVAESEGLPVVVNVSLGAQAGAHDGTSLLELSCDEISGNGRRPGFVIVKSAGNDRTAKMHAMVPVASRSINYLEWDSPTQVNSNWRSRRKDVIDLWFPPFDELQFSLLNPTGESSQTANWSNKRITDEYLTGNTYKIDYVRYHVDNGHSRLLITLERGKALAIAPGIWRLRISAGDLHACLDIHGWIDRSDSKAASFRNHITEEATLSIPGTAKTVISVGAVKVKKGVEFIELAPFSAYGPTRDGRRKPEVSAPGMGIWAAASNTILGSRSEDGTSMAAPHVTGAIGLLLSHLRKQHPAQALNANQIREALATSVRDFNSSWHPGIGHGVIDLMKFLTSFGLVPLPPPQASDAGSVSC